MSETAGPQTHYNESRLKSCTQAGGDGLTGQGQTHRRSLSRYVNALEVVRPLASGSGRAFSQWSLLFCSSQEMEERKSGREKAERNKAFLQNRPIDRAAARTVTRGDGGRKRKRMQREGRREKGKSRLGARQKKTKNGLTRHSHVELSPKRDQNPRRFDNVLTPPLTSDTT